eukprot:5940823-Prymnesium_polylepis.1
MIYRRPQGVERVPNDASGFGLHGLAVGRFSRGLPRGQHADRDPQARCDRVLCRYCAIATPTASAMAEVATDSTLVAHFSLAHGAVTRCAVAQSPRSRQLRKLRTRQDGRTVPRVGLHYWLTQAGSYVATAPFYRVIVD